MDRHPGRHRAGAGILGPHQPQMDLESFPRQPARHQRHHMLRAAAADSRSQQENSCALLHGFLRGKQLSPSTRIKPCVRNH